MRNLLLGLVVALGLSGPARAACTLTTGPLRLEKQTIGDNFSVWAPCMNRNWDVISSSIAVSSSGSTIAAYWLNVGTISALGVPAAAYNITLSSDTYIKERLQVGTTFYVRDARVGLGTASPGARLEVDGAANTNAAIFDGVTTTNQSFGVLIRAGTTGSDRALSVKNAADTDSLLYVDGAGNVGIRNSAPGTKLEVGDADATSAANADVAVAGSINSDAAVRACNAGTDACLELGHDGSVSYIASTFLGGPLNLPLIFRTPAGGTLGDRMRLGAGTALGLSLYSIPLTVSLSSVSVTASNPEFGLKNTSGHHWRLTVGDGGVNNKFQIYDAGQSATRLLIDESGNVGIGTASPSFKLHVAASADAYVGFFNNTNVSGHGLHVRRDGNANSSRNIALFDYAGGASVAMAVRGDGNVGVNETSPNTKLHVSSGIVSIGGSGSGLVVTSSVTIGPPQFTSTATYEALLVNGWSLVASTHPAGATESWFYNLTSTAPALCSSHPIYRLEVNLVQNTSDGAYSVQFSTPGATSADATSGNYRRNADGTETAAGSLETIEAADTGCPLGYPGGAQRVDYEIQAGFQFGPVRNNDHRAYAETTFFGHGAGTGVMRIGKAGCEWGYSTRIGPLYGLRFFVSAGTYTGDLSLWFKCTK